GLQDEEKSATEKRALDLFDAILKRDAGNPYAHYCRGLLLLQQNSPTAAASAREDFTAVTRADDKDAFTWYWLGKTWDDDPAQAVTCYDRALKCDPYLNAARFSLRGALQQVGQAQRAKAVMDEWVTLNDSNWVTPSDDRYYSERGRYARVIGTPADLPAPSAGPLPMFQKDDKLQVQLAPDAHWSADFGTGPVAAVRAAVRKRFGATLVVVDYNRDGKPDLFLLGAVVEKGRVRDLLLRNDGGGHFTDVTAEAGLGGPRPSLGCCVADFDNDGYPDLLITGVGEQHLFRNNRKGGFEDVTARAGFDKLRSVCLGAAFVDLDQDGDLDLVVAQYADTPERALAALEGQAVTGAPGLAVYLNVGEAPATNKGEDPPPLTVAFRRADGPPGLLGGAAAAVNVACTDLDLDQDLDLLVLADGQRPAMVLNDRLLHFHRADLPEAAIPAGRWNGALVLDAFRHQRSDLVLIGPGRRPALLVHQLNRDQADTSKWFEVQDADSPPLLQAYAVDLDFDGWTDLVGLSEQGKPVLLHNDGRRLAAVPEGLGSDHDWPPDLVAVAVADANCDGLPDLLVWSEKDGLQLHVNKGNGNHGLKLEITGHRRVAPAGGTDRCNADAFGARVLAQAGTLWTGAEYTTLSAGLGQSHQPLFLGLGRNTQADVLRVFWPDITWQAEFEADAGPGCDVVHVNQLNRKAVSCPVLFAWDGRRFGFVTDFLGAGSVGECEPGGGHRPPRPEESVKIEAEQLVPRDGQFVLKIAEPMDEVTYLDRLRLVVLDHPADVRVYPDERFPGDGPPPTQDLLAFRQEIFPVRARDHNGRDVTATLRRWDRDTVSDFGRRSWIGFAEDHGVELDFGDRLAQFGPHDRLILCLAGWTDYPYPESIWAAQQAGVELQPPVLERRGPDGRWRRVCEASFPAGLPRMMTLDVTGKLTGPSCVVRLRTNMQVFWDQAFVAPLLETVGPGKGGTVRATALEVDRASLAARGCMQEFSPDGRQPTLYDYDRIDAVPVSRLAGRLTRLGDVT
ncbi:MAG TPA: FG-GAP-like repeat-containing protein, partial [Gemmataceae bacterium]|nr:FG-GAP-like repeat-containing protein [Gemmataceae bacterium]